MPKFNLIRKKSYSIIDYGSSLGITLGILSNVVPGTKYHEYCDPVTGNILLLRDNGGVAGMTKDVSFNEN